MKAVQLGMIRNPESPLVFAGRDLGHEPREVAELDVLDGKEGEVLNRVPCNERISDTI